jgi:GR25 family glycosyltransferase involved in LPS biosynthesis
MKKLHTIDRIFVICNKYKEKDRYENWLPWVSNRNDVEFFSYRWADELSQEEINFWLVRNPEIEATEIKYRTFPINRAEISCSLNWIKLIEKILSDGYERVLIFESDAYFDEYFEDDFNRAIKLVNIIPKNLLDIVSINRGPGINALNNGNCVPGLYKVNSTRAIEGVVLTRQGAIKILDYVYKNKLTMVFDIELRYAIEKNLVNMYWLEPPIVFQTSAEGKAKSFLNQGQFHLLQNKGYDGKDIV